MKYASISSRLSGLGSDKWAVHIAGRRLAAKGENVILLSIGEPDLPPAPSILDVASNQMRAGRTKYSAGEGEPAMLEALSRHYTQRMERPVGTDQFLFLPGTQTALFVAFLSILDPGDEVLLLDPYYATYEAVVTAPGGKPVPVPLDPDRGFHPDIKAIEKAVTPRTRAILLNSPSNPTGAVFTREENLAIGAIAKRHDLWIVSDEVYAMFIHGNHVFHSPFMEKDLEERTIVVSSISKSHALPGFRCGWIAASAEYCKRAVSVTETMLFGSQPFLEDATAHALEHELSGVAVMRDAYLARARVMKEGVARARGVKAHIPEGGMFVMLDVRGTGLSGDDFARRLLNEEKVVTMPGESFGLKGAGHLRVALTVDVDVMAEAARRITAFANRL
ncbi:MAG: pyridoxal phosphate-dependent aminotransferase [Proteobacteria bacterium]|nr:pyridoxal phosphate-dependent aminotransferase [Pseudomonadota bacterium]